MEITASRVIIFLVTIAILEIGHLSEFPSSALLVRPVTCTEQVLTKNMRAMGKFLKWKKRKILFVPKVHDEENIVHHMREKRNSECN